MSNPPAILEPTAPLTWKGQQLTLLPERALYWHEAETLAVADLHWGKGETFRAHGVPVPDGVLADELDRLGRALAQTGARRLLILGDLIHAAVGVTEGVQRQIETWRKVWPVETVLLRGNHDRAVQPFAEAWGMTLISGSLSDGPFAFQHHPEPDPDGRYVWSGHLHPAVKLKTGRSLKSRGQKVPCFYLGQTVGVLPAFSTFTGTAEVSPKRGEQVFLVTEDRVIPWPV